MAQPRGMQSLFTIVTQGPGLYEFTDEVAAWLADHCSQGEGQSDGLLTLFLRHTSCSLLVQENADAAVQRDLAAFLGRLIPSADAPEMRYLTHRQEGPDDMPAHLKAALLPVSLSIPVAAGRMLLGTWQGLYLWEHRQAPHRRQVAAHFG